MLQRRFVSKVWGKIEGLVREGLNSQVYVDLLSQVQPKVIETEAENERYLAEVEKLMALGEELTLEQEHVLRLLVTLIEQYEGQHYQLKPATP